jgi:hypothetical protein
VRSFACHNCGQLLFFENSLCLRCGYRQGFVASKLDLELTRPDDGPALPVCANAALARCNWVVEDADPDGLCVSCRLTRTRPADSDPDGLEYLAVAETAKRRLIFQLLDLELPIEDDLSFELLSSRQKSVTTGHADGVITLDLAESDDVHRERRRAELGEPYRTLLGHFRHEIGHYYWPIVVQRAGRVERYRELFGDEREDYQEALEHHYAEGPPADWSKRHVSAYATMHPWEDWAETFSHYLHIRDTLETAAEYGIVVAGPDDAHDPSLVAAPGAEVVQGGSWRAIIRNWLPLTYALNQINRSMGRDDLYPFTLAPVVVDKLAFVHTCVVGRSPGGDLLGSSPRTAPLVDE